jgi:hypothetical protein
MKYLNPVPKHKLFALRFFIPPILTLLLGKVLFELLVFNFFDLNQYMIRNSSVTHDINTLVKLYEIKARLLWVTSVMASFFINVGFGIFLWNTFRRSLTKGTLWSFLLIAATISALETIYFLYVDASESPIANIFNFTFDSLSGSGLYTANELFIIHSTLDVINLITFIIAPFGIMAGSCIMHEMPMNAHMELKYLLDQSGRLKKLITWGSAIMVIGVIHMQLWLNWPLTFSEGSEMIDQLKPITLAISQYWGVTYTLAIAALYLPAASYLSDQAKIVIERGTDEELKQNSSKWLLENRMSLSAVAQLPQIVAIIGPMLVGSFSSTLSELIFF